MGHNVNHNIIEDIAAIKRVDYGHIENMFDRETKLALVKAGILHHHNGKYTINQDKVNKYLYEAERDKRKYERNEWIRNKTDEIASKRSSRLAAPVNKRPIARRLARKYDRKMNREMKKEYKRNFRIKKWKLKFGELY